jgi:hypothetical protein
MVFGLLLHSQASPRSLLPLCSRFARLREHQPYSKGADAGRGRDTSRSWPYWGEANWQRAGPSAQLPKSIASPHCPFEDKTPTTVMTAADQVGPSVSFRPLSCRMILCASARSAASTITASKATPNAMM